MGALLRVENLSKSFGGLAALRDLSFEVEQGAIVGLIGPNGAGKTTAFNLISGTMRPSAGRVWFRDIDITRGLERLRAPVWIGLGRFDYLVPPAYLWEEVRERFPDLTLRVFDRSAHAPQLEEPEAFDAELLSWLQSKAAAVTKPAER